MTPSHPPPYVKNTYFYLSVGKFGTVWIWDRIKYLDANPTFTVDCTEHCHQKVKGGHKILKHGDNTVFCFKGLKMRVLLQIVVCKQLPWVGLELAALGLLK